MEETIKELHREACEARMKGDNKKSIKLARQGLQLITEHKILPELYPLFHLELSICCFYLNEMEEGLKSTDLVLCHPLSPIYARDNAGANLFFYIKSLPTLNSIILPNELFCENYYSMNSAIIEEHNSYIVLVRYVNYHITPAGYYIYLDGDNVIKNRNILYRINEGFQIQDRKELKDDFDLYQGKIAKGLEDMRMFYYEGKLYALASSFQYSSTPQISLVRIEHDQIVERTLLEGGEGRIEKNWMPLPDNMKAIYKHDPLTIIDLKTGRKEIYPFSQPFRGSSNLLPYREGYLAIVHQVFQPRRYYHRFIYYTRDFNQIKYSVPFYFYHKGIEFCCGMAFSKDKNKIYLTISILDRQTRILIVSLDEVEKML